MWCHVSFRERCQRVVGGWRVGALGDWQTEKRVIEDDCAAACADIWKGKGEGRVVVVVWRERGWVTQPIPEQFGCGQESLWENLQLKIILCARKQWPFKEPLGLASPSGHRASSNHCSSVWSRLSSKSNSLRVSAAIFGSRFKTKQLEQIPVPGFCRGNRKTPTSWIYFLNCAVF